MRRSIDLGNLARHNAGERNGLDLAGFFKTAAGLLLVIASMAEFNDPATVSIGALHAAATPTAAQVNQAANAVPTRATVAQLQQKTGAYTPK